MITQVLLRYLLQTAAVLAPAVLVVSLAVMGSEVAIGVGIGLVVALGNGAGLVYLVGELLQPNAQLSKLALFALLLGKLLLGGGLLWTALNIWAVSGLGLIIGIGAGLGILILGLNRGSASEAGQKAMNAEEERIRREVGDNDSDPS